MAEYLVYNKVHWMDKLALAEVEIQISLDPDFAMKYLRRYQKGDVIEVRPDGYWTGAELREFDKDTFLVISKPGEIDYKYLLSHKEISKESGESVILKRRRYNINIDNISVSIHNKSFLTDQQLTEVTVDKSNG